MTTEYSGSGDLTRSLELLWGTQERPTRGPKPALSVERIVESAILVADSEGLAGLSMRRIATELGVGTMSLYRYVPSKAELVDLMIDSVYGERQGLLQQERIRASREGWRADLELVARSSWELHHRHPWLLQVSQARPIMGPNSLRGLETGLRVMDGIGLTEGEMMAMLALVDGYVTGTARTIVEASQAAQRTGISDEHFWQAQAPFLEKVMSDERFSTVARVMRAGTFSGDDDGFDFGLQRVLDGIEAYIRSRSS